MIGSRKQAAFGLESFEEDFVPLPTRLPVWPSSHSLLQIKTFGSNHHFFILRLPKSLSRFICSAYRHIVGFSTGAKAESCISHKKLDTSWTSVLPLTWEEDFPDSNCTEVHFKENSFLPSPEVGSVEFTGSRTYRRLAMSSEASRVPCKRIYYWEFKKCTEE